MACLDLANPRLAAPNPMRQIPLRNSSNLPKNFYVLRFHVGYNKKVPENVVRVGRDPM